MSDLYVQHIADLLALARQDLGDDLSGAFYRTHRDKAQALIRACDTELRDAARLSPRNQEIITAYRAFLLNASSFNRFAWRATDNALVSDLRQPPPRRGRASGYVYLIQELSRGYYKIGKAKEAVKRIHKFEVVLPFAIETVCTVYSDNRHKLESELHRRFADKRVNGEWFALTADDVAYIQGLADGS